MENAAEALKMAAWVLIFVVALSITMNALTHVKQSVDTIMVDVDREYSTQYLDGTTAGERIVSAKDVVSTVYRVYKNARYIVQFPFNIYYDTKNKKDVNTLSISQAKLNDKEKDYFIKRIMTGKPTDEKIGEKKIEELLNDYNYKFIDNFKIYDELNKNGKKIVEKTGIYFKQELDNSESTNAKKDEIRVIKYEYLND
ncbi:MAG: hypothetical protein IKF38_07275 [Clostridia bacterium]|nr:hypothetical protein [Clostridia bacterium]